MIRSIALLAALPLAALAGCTSISSNYTGAITQPNAYQMIVCHGYNCRLQTKVPLSAEDNDRFAAILAEGAESPQAERAAIARAVQFYEERAVREIGVRDQARSTLTDSGQRGQMDCIDESTNSRTLLLYLQNTGKLRHHRVLTNVSRGFFVDGRYPHSTAVIADPGGAKWAVDSWFEATGGPPDIMPLAEWTRRGVMGAR